MNRKQSKDKSYTALVSIIVIFLLAPALLAGPYSVNSVPNPKLQSGNFISDPDNYIEEDKEDALNTTLQDLEQKTSVEFAVVVVDSIGAANSKDFAVELFNTWGIGKKGKDNGLLLLIAIKEKRWEFETGYGLEGELPDVVLKRIGVDRLVPFFKIQAYGLGIESVIKEINSILIESKELDSSNQNSDPIDSEIIESNKLSERIKIQNDRFNTHSSLNILGFAAIYGLFIYAIYHPVRNNFKNWKYSLVAHQGVFNIKIWSLGAIGPLLYSIYVIILLGFILETTLLTFYIYSAVYFGCSLVFQKTVGNGSIATGEPNENPFNQEKVNSYSSYKNLKSEIFNVENFLVALFFPLPLLFVNLFLLFRLRQLRNLPRNSEKNGKPMHKLTEEMEDFFLNEGQRIEESLGSVDYDVWVTEDKDDILILTYDANYTSYSNCSSCNFKTKYLAKSKTIDSADCDKSGTGERTYICKKCNHTSKELYSIPRINCEKSSGSSSYKSSSSWSSSSSSYSSSRSSSSSFGGGRSGGGGAGGSW